MQYIQKAEQDSILFSDAIKNWNEVTESFETANDYKNLNYKTALRIFLVNEQYQLCAICQQRISPLDQSEAIINDEHVRILKSNIEHINPQSENGDDSLTYRNLVASCDSDRHCNHYRQNKHIIPYFLDSRSFSSIDRSNDFFDIEIFSTKIKPKGTLPEKKARQVQEFIDAYNLNHESLLERRKARFSTEVLKEFRKNPTKQAKFTQEISCDLSSIFREFTLLYLRALASL